LPGSDAARNRSAGPLRFNPIFALEAGAAYLAPCCERLSARHRRQRAPWFSDCRSEANGYSGFGHGVEREFDRDTLSQ
jgi:hypothetical protein